MGENLLPEAWLCRCQELVPVAIDRAKKAKRFPSKWKLIISKLDQIPLRLSDLSTHPFFSKNDLCKEQLQAVWSTLNEAIEFADKCEEYNHEGKLRMQSDLDVLSAKLDLNLRDCGILIRTGVLGEITHQIASADCSNLGEILARLQIGHLEAKHRALDTLLEIMKDDEKSIFDALGRSNVAALVQLLTTSSNLIREKSVTVICSLADSRNCQEWLVSENVIPPLIRLVEFASSVGKEKAAISLQRLSGSSETACLIASNGGIRPLVEICQNCGSGSASVAASVCTLKNISFVPELRKALAEEGIVRAMIDLLDQDIDAELKENAAQCLQNLSSSDEDNRRIIVDEGGIRSLIAYLDQESPHDESAVGALANLVSLVSTENLVSLGVIPTLARALKSGSNRAQLLSATAICRICTSNEAKKIVGEGGLIIPLLIKMLEAKENELREVAAQAICGLMSIAQNCKEVKKDQNSVPNLVLLLDPSPHNTAKKYAAACLVSLSSSKKCRKLMISHGAIGYLKKLSEMDNAPCAKTLLQRLQNGKLICLFRTY